MSTTKPKCSLSVGMDNRSAEKKKKPLDPNDEIPSAGKIIIITGANSGIGQAAAYEFAKRGAKVVMPCRDMKKAQIVVDDMKEKTPNADVVLLPLDLADMDSIRKCAEDIKNNFDHIDILVNNAGFYDPSKILQKTKHGFESHMGINHLGPLLFTMLLLDHVKKAAPSRIVFTSSMGHQMADLKLDDIMCEKSGTFGPANLGPYANSKLANMLCAYSLAKKLSDSGVNTYALCPGNVKSGFTRNVHGLLKLLEPLNHFLAIEPEEGAQNILYCSLSNKCAGETGLMYRCNGLWEGAMEKAVDDQLAETFWEMSLKLVGIDE